MKRFFVSAGACVLVVGIWVIVIPLGVAFNATLQAGTVFVVTAAVSGFFAWLVGATWLSVFVVRFVKVVSVVREARQKKRIQDALEKT